MRDYRLQARTALKVYLDRGKHALAQFDAGDLEGFVETLRLKSAAFHNFRAADGILAKAGIQSENDVEMVALWPEIADIDRLLTDAVNAAAKFTSDELKRNQRVRNSIGKYRSRKLRDTGFERSV
jgi:hypothetical protein